LAGPLGERVGKGRLRGCGALAVDLSEQARSDLGDLLRIGRRLRQVRVLAGDRVDASVDKPLVRLAPGAYVPPLAPRPAASSGHGASVLIDRSIDRLGVEAVT